MASTTEHVAVEGGDMELYVSLPEEGSAPAPGVVVAQHAGGVDEFIRTMCDRLAEAGYAAAAPALYHRLGEGEERSPRALKDVEMIADVGASADYLRARASVDGEALAVIGFCMGGRVAYLMAAAVPAFRAAVAYYGGNTAVALGEEGTASPFERTAEISCPLLFHFGGDDGNPSPEDREKLHAELERHGKEHEFHSYADAGHAFMDFTGARYAEVAAAASWPRTLDFLARHRRGARPPG